MVEMAMGEQDLLQGQTLTLQWLEHPVQVATRVDDRCPFCMLVADDRAVLLKSGHRNNKDFHHPLQPITLETIPASSVMPTLPEMQGAVAPGCSAESSAPRSRNRRPL